jgi:hypothetical protein
MRARGFGASLSTAPGRLAVNVTPPAPILGKPVFIWR